MSNSTPCSIGGLPNTSSAGLFTKDNCSMPLLDLLDFDCPPSPQVLLPLVAGYSVVSLVGLLGNLCLLGVIQRRRETQNVTSLLIGNLAVSDALVCLICIPFTLVYTLMDQWVFGEAMCKITSYVQCLSVSVSSFSLVLIAVERYQLIVNPRGWKPSVVHAHWGIGATWLASGVLSLPFLLFHRVMDEPFHNISQGLFRDSYVCVDAWPSEHARLGFYTCLLVLQYFAPLGFILVCYRRVAVCLRNRGSRPDRGRDSEVRLSESKRINTLLVSIVAAFAICWLPLNVFNLVFDWHYEALQHCQHNLLFTLCHLMAMVSTCINPVFYGFLNRNFQKDLQGLAQCCGCRSAPEEYNNISLNTLHADTARGSIKLNNHTANNC